MRSITMTTAASSWRTCAACATSSGHCYCASGTTTAWRWRNFGTSCGTRSGGSAQRSESGRRRRRAWPVCRRWPTRGAIAPRSRRRSLSRTCRECVGPSSRGPARAEQPPPQCRRRPRPRSTPAAPQRHRRWPPCRRHRHRRPRPCALRHHAAKRKRWRSRLMHRGTRRIRKSSSSSSRNLAALRSMPRATLPAMGPWKRLAPRPPRAAVTQSLWTTPKAPLRRKSCGKLSKRSSSGRKRARPVRSRRRRPLPRRRSTRRHCLMRRRWRLCLCRCREKM
mmetsp:Transcript_99379/g.286811  ORF Transcript_99379/g.286811 Transcript_99379/m.286811 type:complete len:279 (-) Transcript_99379:237-1073(-)